jgi:Cdc6-like AAA superfamily ATPase
MVKAAKPQILKEKINKDEKIIIEILEERRKLLSGELYREYSKKVEMPVSERMFRNFVNHLAEMNLVKVADRKRGIKGRTRVISRV